MQTMEQAPVTSQLGTLGLHSSTGEADRRCVQKRLQRETPRGTEACPSGAFDLVRSGVGSGCDLIVLTPSDRTLHAPIASRLAPGSGLAPMIWLALVRIPDAGHQRLMAERLRRVDRCGLRLVDLAVDKAVAGEFKNVVGDGCSLRAALRTRLDIHVRH